MDPEVSGKRHVRDGSITVAELIRRQPYFVAAPAAAEPAEEPGAMADGGADGVYEVAPTPVTPEDGTGRPSLVARIFAVAVGTAALFGAVAATATISTSRPENPAAFTRPAGTPITGATALRPDLVAERLGYLPTRDSDLLPNTTTPPTTVPAGPPAPPPDAAANQQATSSAPPTTTGTANPAATPGSPEVRTTRPLDQPVDVVREFYRRLANRTDDAQALLDPALLGADLPGFRTSWQSLRDVEPVSITPQPDGSVLGTVAMQLADGTRMRMQQHFYFGGGHPPVIEHVELVSAQPS